MNEQPRILIVDDTPANIKVLHNLLREDYALSVATSGAGALKDRILGRIVPTQLVLLDVMMPEMDGHEVCRRLKADSRTRDVPVIFVTAMSEVEDETKGFGMGAVDYITKPIRPPIVEARVATHTWNSRGTQTVLTRAEMRFDAGRPSAGRQGAASLLPKDHAALRGSRIWRAGCLIRRTRLAVTTWTSCPTRSSEVGAWVWWSAIFRAMARPRRY